MGVLLAAGAAGLGVEVVNLLGTQVEELHEEQDAVGGFVAGFADLLNFFVGEVGLLLRLGVEGYGERGEEGEDRQQRQAEAALHRASIRFLGEGWGRKMRTLGRVEGFGVLRCAQDDSRNGG